MSKDELEDLMTTIYDDLADEVGSIPSKRRRRRKTMTPEIEITEDGSVALKEATDRVREHMIEQDIERDETIKAMNYVFERLRERGDIDQTFTLKQPVKTAAWRGTDVRTIALNGSEELRFKLVRAGKRSKFIYAFDPATEADKFGDDYDYIEFDDTKVFSQVEGFREWHERFGKYVAEYRAGKGIFAKAVPSEEDYSELDGFGDWA